MDKYDGKIAIIGFGNMGSAIYNGLLKAELVSQEQIVIIRREDNANELIKGVDVIILAVKPTMISEVASCVDLKRANNPLIISVAAGITLKYLKEVFGGHLNIVRAMINTPALVSEAMSALCGNETQLPLASKLFSAIGLVEIVKEEQMDAIIAISGSAPAYVFMFIEALADAGVKLGLPRDLAYKMVSQTVKGSGELQLMTKLHPGVLKDQVCSPGGTTIAAVAQLEAAGFRNAIISAATECYQRVKELEK
ncbi:MAG: pyrroline-5-carboxylate reductase [Lentisphaeria bacterium]